MSIFERLAAMIRADGRAALISVASVLGSAPRNAGVMMAVRADGACSGTIGGGTLEWLALAEAQVLLAATTGSSLRRIDRALGPDLGQCCGGRVRLTIERLSAADLDWLDDLGRAVDEGAAFSVGYGTALGHFRRRAATAEEAGLLGEGEQRILRADGALIERIGIATMPVFLFGAGHVGRALALAMAPLPFGVRWIDSRPEAFPPHIPANVSAMHRADPVVELGEAPHGAVILVMTHSHALDLAIVSAALRLGRFLYVGVIGSATKRARFLSRMRQAGLADDLAASLVCPIGLAGITGKEPAVIAASVVAQILPLREVAAARRQDGVVRQAGNLE